MDIPFIPKSEFDRFRSLPLDEPTRLKLIADGCRLNALSAVKRAGSGHLGSSLSAMDVVVRLYEAEMNTVRVGIASPDRDVYFSSKGHDVPGLYAVLFSHGIVPLDRFLRLRRMNGLDGHPDVGVPGIEANSGSLGMGISKGRGIAWAKTAQGNGGRVFVMIGDGELQEGQNYEALRTTVNQGVHNLTVLVDHNKVQSDKPVEEIGDLGDLERKFAAFGWHVTRCDGNDPTALGLAFLAMGQVSDRPTMLIADTLKGAGVSFMEHPRALATGKGQYPWHAGAPDDASFEAAHLELRHKIENVLRDLAVAPLALFVPEPPELLVGPALQVQNSLGEPVSIEMHPKVGGMSGEYVVEAYGDALLELADEVPEMVVLDADLAADCRTRKFERAHPDRFIQCGIAEQDMVSMAGGLARHGRLPIVNSFASFLASRANEQIYNNATEKSKIIYANHYGGLIPAGPGKSHQSLRDVSLLTSIPGVTVVQPANAAETRAALRWMVLENPGVGVLRLAIGPSPRTLETPPLVPGRGCRLTEGEDAVLFAYGPVMLSEAMLAAEALAERGFGLRVVNLPWLNRFDVAWLESELAGYERAFVLEDHARVGGLGDRLVGALHDAEVLPIPFHVYGIDGHPGCGTPPEVLRFHGLDGPSIAARILARAR
ncbi:MAG: hypothetical protein KIS66_14400 [Fimbriimonadaceae bacterium]|nr:hypothetical protein [Fimbriimonadaceae bacterium]